MNDLLKEIVLRIFIGTVICTICLLIVGKGGHREPVRLCCSAIMIILIFSPYNMGSFDVNDMFNVKQNVEEEIHSEIKTYEEQKNQMAILSVEKYLEQKIKQLNITCNIKLFYDFDNDVIKINNARISKIENEKDKEIIYDILINELGLERCEIIFD